MDSARIRSISLFARLVFLYSTVIKSAGKNCWYMVFAVCQSKDLVGFAFPHVCLLLEPALSLPPQTFRQFTSGKATDACFRYSWWCHQSLGYVLQFSVHHPVYVKYACLDWAIDNLIHVVSACIILFTGFSKAQKTNWQLWWDYTKFFFQDFQVDYRILWSH